jgi:LmbE family N-acetylglucosaminyl deacetylase
MRLDDDLAVLVVSPHLDDAMLSCTALFHRRRPADVLTVFAGSPSPAVSAEWDRLCGFADSDEALAARRAEEQAAFAGLAVDVDYLPLLDSQYTGDAPRTASERDVLSKAIVDWAAGRPSPVVALPAGCGRPRPSPVEKALRTFGVRVDPQGSAERPAPHPDHLFVRDVGLSVLAEKRGVVGLLYEEVPYAGGVDDAAAVRRSAGKRWAPVDFELEVDVTEKASRLAAYVSQLPWLTGGDPRATLRATERYWRLEPRRRWGDSV